MGWAQRANEAARGGRSNWPERKPHTPRDRNMSLGQIGAFIEFRLGTDEKPKRRKVKRGAWKRYKQRMARLAEHIGSGAR